MDSHLIRWAENWQAKGAQHPGDKGNPLRTWRYRLGVSSDLINFPITSFFLLHQTGDTTNLIADSKVRLFTVIEVALEPRAVTRPQLSTDAMALFADE